MRTLPAEKISAYLASAEEHGVQNMIHNEYKKQRMLLEQGKVPQRPSTYLNPTADQYLALQKENHQLQMENELLRDFRRKFEKR